MNIGPIHKLARRWRDEAERFRHRGLHGQAEMTESYASDLEACLREWELEALTLEEAAAESGYSYSTLQKQVSNGKIPNAGEPRRPLIARTDLPLKGGRMRELSIVEPDLAGEILNGPNSQKGGQRG